MILRAKENVLRHGYFQNNCHCSCHHVTALANASDIVLCICRRQTTSISKQVHLISGSGIENSRLSEFAKIYHKDQIAFL